MHGIANPRWPSGAKSNQTEIIMKARTTPPKNVCAISIAAMLVCCGWLALRSAAAEEWVAFNDCVDTDPASTPENATSFGLGRSYVGDGSSGELIDFETGEGTGVSASFTENFSGGNTINWASDFADFTDGTDAEQTFGGKLNLAGNMSYNDEPGWSLDLTFSNLDPAAAYTFAATVHRNGGPDYQMRISNWKIIGADASTYACSADAHKVSEQSVEFITGHNPAGLVARWTDIHPAVDGSFTIRTSHGVGEADGGLPNPDSYRGYAGGLFMLMAQPGTGQPFAITSIDYDTGADSTTITWPTRPGRNYAVDASDDLVEWDELDDGVTADSDATSYTETDVQAPGGRRFYRVRRL